MPLPSLLANGTSYKLAMRRVNVRNRRAKQCEGPRGESLQSPLILLFSVVAIVIIYTTAHTDYTQYINTCSHGQARPTMLVASV